MQRNKHNLVYVVIKHDHPKHLVLYHTMEYGF